MNSQSLQFILPELILAVFALGAMLGGAFARDKKRIGLLALLGVIVSACFLPLSLQAGPSAFSDMLINDPFSVFFRVVILFVMGIVILLSIGYQEIEEDDRGEYYFFLLVTAVSMLLAAAANNLLLIYIAIEAISIVSYILVGYARRDILSSEGGVKYFLFGALSTGVMLYGISLIYGILGSLDLNVISNILIAHPVNQLALLAALIFILVGLGFKSSLVPFHMWTPDVYQGAPTPIAGLLSVGPKAVGFALLLRLFIQNFHAFAGHWTTLAIVIAMATMTLGNVMAIGQSSVKRLLAFSSIAQAGYILVGVAVGTSAGVSAVLFYIFIYALMNLGAFGAVIMISHFLKSDTLEDYAGYYQRDPFTAIVLTISLLSLAGIPPLAGFLAKFFILSAAVDAHLTTLALVAALNSVIALYYYARIVKFMFFHEPRETSLAPKSLPLQTALIVTVIGNVALGLWPHPILHWLASLGH